MPEVPDKEEKEEKEEATEKPEEAKMEESKIEEETKMEEEVCVVRWNEEQRDSWEQKLDQGTQAFLEKTQEKTLAQILAEQTAADEKEKEIWKTAEEAFVAKKTLPLPGEDAKETRQCGICKKVFRSGEFVKKHLLAKHSSLLKVVETKAVLRELVRSDYLKDPAAKIPTIIPVKNRAARNVEVASAPKKTEEFVDKAKLLEYGLREGET